MVLVLDSVLGRVRWLVLAPREDHGGIGKGAGCGACAVAKSKFIAVVRRGLWDGGVSGWEFGCEWCLSFLGNELRKNCMDLAL